MNLGKKYVCAAVCVNTALLTINHFLGIRWFTVLALEGCHECIYICSTSEIHSSYF